MNLDAIYWLVLIAPLALVTVWAFDHRRKKRFEQDAKIPFEE